MIEIDVEGSRLLRQTLVRSESANPQMVASADGRYVAWLGETFGESRALSVFDRDTGSGGRQRGWAPAVWPDNFRSIVAHPTEVRAFVTIDAQLLELSAAGVRALDTRGPVRTIDGISADGHTLLLSRPIGADRRVVRFDTRTDTTLEESVFALEVGSLVLAPDGASLYLHAYGSEPGNPSHIYRRIDAATGALLAERIEPGLGMRQVVAVDPHTGRVYVTPIDGTFQVLDPVTLALVGTVTHTLPGPTRIASTQLVFDPHLPRLFLLAARDPGPSATDGGTVIDVFDVGTLARIGGGSLGIQGGFGSGSMVVVPRPPSPATLSAVVDGSRVTLQWAPGSGPGRATGFRVEAGSAPGLADVARIEAPDSLTFSVAAVPAATYHVRVRATSRAGTSDPSPEVVVRVP